MNRQVPLLRFSASDQKCDREKSGARHNDNKDENDRAPNILSLRHRSNLLPRSERDRHPNQTENGEGKGIIGGERRRPERVCSQSKADNRGDQKSKQQPVVRVHLRNYLQHPRHATEKTKSRSDRQAKLSDHQVIGSCSCSCPKTLNGKL